MRRAYALGLTAIGTGRDPIVGILDLPSMALTTPITQIITTNTALEGVLGTIPLQAPDTITLPTTRRQDRNLTS